MPLAVLASFVAAFATMAGVFAMRRRENWARANKACFVSFAAGVLIAVTLLRLIPEAFTMTGGAALGLLAGYFGLHILDRTIASGICDQPKEKERALGLVSLAGIGIHSFLDGLTYSVGFSVGATTGLLMALGMVVHEFPEGIVTYGLLRCGGYDRRGSTMLTLMAAALTTPLGTLISYPLVDQLEAPVLGTMLSVSAGALLYVGATHLLPQTAGVPNGATLVALLGGIAVAVAISLGG